jgi:hypothetical protein
MVPGALMKATKVHPVSVDCHASTAQPMQSKHYAVRKRLLSANWDVEAGHVLSLGLSARSGTAGGGPRQQEAH